MRLALGGLLLFILLFLISVPLTGGMSIILIPVLPWFALYLFGTFAAVVIAAKVIQKCVGIQGGLSLAAISVGLFIAMITISAAWRWIDSFGCPAMIESLAASGPDQHWRTQKVEFVGKALAPEVHPIRVSVAGGAQKSIASGKDARGFGYTRVMSNTVGIGQDHPVRAEGPKPPGCDYLATMPGLTISFDAVTGTGSRKISSGPLCITAAELAAWQQTKVDVFESNPRSSTHTMVARVLGEPKQKPMVLRLHRPLWYAFPLYVLVPRLCITPGVRFHSLQAFGAKLSDLPPVNVLAAAVALRAVFEKQ
jgi:hypothetical protein